MIVSMATEEYIGYLHIMLSSLFYFNPKYNATVYLINCNEKQKSLLQQEFPRVNFRQYEGTFSLKDRHNPNNEKKVVTHLKGKFMHEVSKETDKVIWIDATALIRGKLNEIYNALDNYSATLVKRPSQNPKFSFAAEIFGFNSINQEIIRHYVESCEKLKSDWFADQLSLNTIPTEQSYYLEFGKYCNFTYQGQAITWSDRGRTGKGNLTSDDNEYTLKIFKQEMLRFINNFPGKHDKFMQDISNADDRIKILCYTDENNNWCYSNTVNEITHQLKDYFKFTIVHNATNERSKVLNWEGDLVWCRCDSRRAKKLYSVRRNLKQKAFSSITIGGELVHERIESNLHNMQGENGVICQNKEAEFILRQKGKENVFILPNGVDTEKFQYVDKEPKKFIVGFAGRISKPNEDNCKGFSKYVKAVCKDLGLPLVQADDLNNQYKHHEMPEFFKKISILVLPSFAEGCSNTILEAQASGIPVITTRTGWHFENCEDYKHLIFCSRNIIDIREKIQYLMENKRIRTFIKQNARKFAEAHSWKEISEHYKQQFNKMKELVQ